MWEKVNKDTAQDEQIKKNVYWISEDTTRAVELFLFFHAIAGTRRDTKRVTICKANSSGAGRSLVEKYGTDAIYEKLYSIIRQKLKKKICNAYLKVIFTE